ncbi:MAG: hypothetical protein U0414_41620 [Polyangiaceae bacterium]
MAEPSNRRAGTQREETTEPVTVSLVAAGSTGTGAAAGPPPIVKLRFQLAPGTPEDLVILRRTTSPGASCTSAASPTAAPRAPSQSRTS